MRTLRNCIYVAITLAFTAGGLCQQVKPQTVTAPLADRKSQPVVSDVTVSKAAVTDVHLRPLFTTTIRLPDAVSSVAVGAPTLFEAEHADQEPRLVYIKPATKQPAESNLVITMRSGETISMRLISDGNSALNEPVDYIVDYKPQESFFIGSSDPIEQKSQERSTEEKYDLVDLALQGQARVSTPAWQSSTALDEKTSKTGPPSIVGALGEIRETNGRMLVAYSIRNQSNHWIEVLPPQIEISSPDDKSEVKKKDRKHIVEAEQVPVNSFKVNGRRLAPGERVDGVVTFDRPGFKQSKERLLLELASANSVDKPLLLPVPFVAPSD
jgi:hypothetical protein